MRVSLILSVFLLAFIHCLHVWGSPALSELKTIERPPTINYFEKQIVKPAFQNATDLGAYLISPLQWDADQWKIAGSVAAITGLMILVDKPIFDYFDKDNFSDFNNATGIFFSMGETSLIVFGVPTLFAAGLALGDSKLQHASYLAYKSFGFQLLTTQFFKDLFLRRVDGDPYQFEGPKWNFPSDEGGLPSGHAGIAWSVLTVYAEEYRKEQPFVTTFCYASAILSSVALMTNQNHWVSDIFMGSAIGYYTAMSVLNMDRNNPAFTVYPILIGGGYGLGFSQPF